jgi:Family of unknown function (DUF6159)
VRRPGVVRTVVGVLRRRPGLLGFPALAAGTDLVLAGVAYAPLSATWERARHGAGPTSGGYVVVAALLVLMSCATTYYGAALQHAVHELAGGARPSVGASLRVTLTRLPTLLAWKLLNATVGLVGRALEAGGLTGVLTELLGWSWSMSTFFVLPVVVAEGGGIRTAVRRSIALSRGHRGDWVAGGVRVLVTAGVSVIVGLAVLMVAVASNDATTVLTAVALVLALWLLTALLTTTSTGVYRMTLYHRATTASAG